VEIIYRSFLASLEPPARPATDACSLCRRPIAPRYETCLTCVDTIGQVTRPASLVIPIAFYRLGSPAHAVLRGYKDHPTPSIRRTLSGHVARLVAAFLAQHRACIASAARTDWDAIVVVPSTTRPGSKHPLHLALASSPALASELVVGLHRTTAHLDHNHASDQAYRPASGVLRRRVLLIDDTYTTGARLHSAASALQTSDVRVVAAVVVGRILDQDQPLTRRGSASARPPFRLKACLLCGPAAKYTASGQIATD